MDSALYKKIQSDLVSSMKQRQDPKEAMRLDVLRMVVAEIKNRKIDKGEDLKEEEIVSVLKKAVKTREDSISQYESAGRGELALKEKEEIEIIKSYLPEELSTEDVRRIVKEAITDAKNEGLDTSSAKSFGILMKKTLSLVPSDKSVNNALISQIIKEEIQTS